MKSPIVDFGIAGFGLAFGEDQDVEKTAGEFVSDPERVVRWGYHTYHRAPDGVTATNLATDAANQALSRLNMTADDLDLIVVATSEMPEYLHWDTSASLARALNLPCKQTMLLTEGCSSGVTGMGAIAGIMAMQPEIENALFVAVNRVSEFHRNRMNTNNSVHSDGAVAAVLRRGHTGSQWLATEQFTDPEFCDWFRTEYGGASTPIAPDGWSSRTAIGGSEVVQAHFEKDPKRLRAFGERLNERVVAVIEKACVRAGVDRADVKKIVYINDPDGCDDVALAAGIPIENTNAEMAKEHGHMGAADQLIALAQYIERGEVTTGDLVALCGISIGLRWYCTLVRV